MCVLVESYQILFCNHSFFKSGYESYNSFLQPIFWNIPLTHILYAPFNMESAHYSKYTFADTEDIRSNHFYIDTVICRNMGIKHNAIGQHHSRLAQKALSV